MAKAKLLIIEDDEGLCSQYRWAFPEYDLLFAHTRAQGVALALKEQPAVAVTDLGLPPDADGVSEGFAALDAFANQLPEARAILDSLVPV